MGMQMKFNFASEESIRFPATLDGKTLIKVVELMAQMIVMVQEKRKEEKHYCPVDFSGNLGKTHE